MQIHSSAKSFSEQVVKYALRWHDNNPLITVQVLVVSNHVCYLQNYYSLEYLHIASDIVKIES